MSAPNISHGMQLVRVKQQELGKSKKRSELSPERWFPIAVESKGPGYRECKTKAGAGPKE